MSEPQTEQLSDPSRMDYSDGPTFDDSNITTANGRIEMDQDEVDSIIRNKRKVRDPKACYACHRRKVKCDRNLPCDSCVKRDHPELCSYERPTKKKRIALNNTLAQQVETSTAHSPESPLNAAGPNVTVPKEQWERINAELQQLKAAVQGTESGLHGVSTSEQDDAHSRGDISEREGVHAPSIQMGTMHLGSRSILAYMMGNKSKASREAAKVLLEENILPNLGLDNETATYPFIDLWSTDSSIQDVRGLCGALPEDSLCLEFWTAYRDITCTIYPVVPDAEAFESTLNYVLRQRAEHMRQGLEIDATRPYGVSMPWLALLFAVLASGAQSTSRTAKERELTSQVYICCSYQALRMANFLLHGCLETIEACLIIGNALAYNMNPGVAYTFLGMTLRSALSIGLHVSSQKFSDHENYLRGRIWWALAWQDSHFSVSYDRPSSSILCFPDIPYTKHSTPGTRSYVESMSAMIRFTQQILRDRTLNPKAAMTWTAIQNYKEEVNRIIADAQPRLRDRSLCVGVAQHLERLAFQLHNSYMMSEICRPSLKESTEESKLSRAPVASPKNDRRASSRSGSVHSPGSSTADANVMAQLRVDCINSLERTVEAYVEIHEQHSIYAARSWIGIQRAISAAFLLGILPETRQEPRVVQLLVQLEKVLAARAHEDVGFDSAFEDDAHGSPVLKTGRRVSVVNHGGSRPGTSESPNWARSMTKSLHALGKLNAALSSRRPATLPKNFTPATGFNPSIYATPTLSPTGHTHRGSGLNKSLVPLQSAAPQYNSSLNMPAGNDTQQHQQHQMSASASGPHVKNDQYSPLGHFSHPLPIAPGQRPGSGAPTNSSLGLGPVTPDSGSVCSGGSTYDWNTGNIKEAVMEFVTPGLWG